MAAPLVIAVVHLIVRLEILALQVKSGPPRGNRLWLRPQAALCATAHDGPAAALGRHPDTPDQAAGMCGRDTRTSPAKDAAPDLLERSGRPNGQSGTSGPVPSKLSARLYAETLERFASASALILLASSTKRRERSKTACARSLRAASRASRASELTFTIDHPRC